MGTCVCASPRNLMKFLRLTSFFANYEGTLLAYGASLVLHSGLAVWLGMNMAEAESVNQGSISLEPITISIVTQYGDSIYAPEAAQKKGNMAKEMTKEPSNRKEKPPKKRNLITHYQKELAKAEVKKQSPQPISVSKTTGIKTSAKKQASLKIAEKNGDELHYNSLVRALLEKHKTYPRKAQKRKIEGVVEIIFTIDITGEIISKHLKKSSGSRTLDKAALQSLERANPLPPLPEKLGTSKLTLTVPFGFFLM